MAKFIIIYLGVFGLANSCGIMPSGGKLQSNSDSVIESDAADGEDVDGDGVADSMAVNPCLPLAGIGLASGPFFNPDVATIFEGSCLSCHAAGAQAPDLSSFAKVKAAIGPSIDSIVAGRMPKGSKMSSGDLDALKLWQSNGSPYSAGEATPTGCVSASSPSGDPAPAELTPDERMSQLMGIYCVTCHSAKKEEPDLSTLARVISDRGDVSEKISQGIMPPKNSPQLKSDEKSFVLNWLKSKTATRTKR